MMTAPKLSSAEAREARILRATTGFTIKDIAVEYGVSLSAMSKVVHGISYKQAGGPIEPPAERNYEPAAHGRPGRYGYWGCRCPLCTATNADRCRNYRRTHR